MKFLYATTVSGTLNFLTPHINMLVDQGHEVDILTNVNKEIDDKILKSIGQVYDVKFERSPINFNNLTSINKIKNIVKEGNYDVIHTHTPIASFLIRLACKGMENLKIVYTAHGFHFYKGAPLKNWLVYYPVEKLASRWTSSIITINEEDYLFANKYFSKKTRIHKTNGVGINFEKFSIKEVDCELNKKYHEKFVLFYAAELNINKNQELLIKTIDLIKDIIPNVILLLAGTGESENQYKKLISELNLENYVEFLGYRKDIPQILTITDLVVASSKREGLPVNLMEAMVSKVPVIATDNRGHRSLIQNNINGFLVYNNDAVEFKEKTIMLYESKELKRQFINEGYNNVKKYTVSVVLEQLDSIYKELN